MSDINHGRWEAVMPQVDTKLLSGTTQLPGVWVVFMLTLLLDLPEATLSCSATLRQVSSLSLPLAKLVAVYEQLVLELLEMRELDVARYDTLFQSSRHMARRSGIDVSEKARWSGI